MAAPLNMSNITDSDKSLLETGEGQNEDIAEEHLYNQLLLQLSDYLGDTVFPRLFVSSESTQAAAVGGLNIAGAEEHETTTAHKTVRPKPGFCVKTSDDKGNKIFINICQTEHIPAPKNISDDELAKVWESDAPDYRVPLSIGEPHAEVDKGGKGCAAYDIAINSEFFNKICTNDLFKEFFMSVVYEGLENKYDIVLKRNWIQLKNKKFHGAITEHNIRAKSKPRITEVEEVFPNEASKSSIKSSSKPLITELESSSVGISRAPQPEYVIMREPIEGHPGFLVAEIQLPKVRTAKLLTLDLGEDRIVLHAHPGTYCLDIYLPFIILQDESGAQFNKRTKVLTLTLPVRPL